MKVTENRLFATSIYAVTLPNFEIFNKKFQDYIYKEKELDPLGNTRSNSGGWHSKHLPFRDNIIQEFCNMTSTILNKIADSLEWDTKNYQLGFSEVWSIINKKGDFNLGHRHPSSILSLAYYVRCPKQPEGKGGEIYFSDPRVAAINPKPKLKSNNERLLSNTHNAGKLNIPPSEGLLLIFPGWLEHGVHQNKSDEDRIVISANTKLAHKNE